MKSFLKSNGISYPAISSSDLMDIRVTIPESLADQERISQYLDKKVQIINSIIDHCKKRLNALSSYRQSLIARAVTKGLDQDMKMKDSGFQWLGKIPIDWTVHYPKALFTVRNERMREGDIQLTASQEYGMITQSEFQEREGRRVVQVILNPDILKHVEPGDFVMHMRSFQGGLELSKQAGCVSSAYVMIHARDSRVCEDYYRYLFKSAPYINALRVTSNLIRDGQALRFGNFIQIYLPLPPFEVQEQIVAYLDKHCAAINQTTSCLNKIIAKLGEYRESIIHHAVTGKIDCTE